MSNVALERTKDPKLTENTKRYHPWRIEEDMLT